MPTITVKLDKKRAARLARWARRSKVPKSECPARRFLSSLRRRPILVSIVSVEEVLEGAADQATAESLNADVVGADRAAFERLGARCLRFR